MAATEADVSVGDIVFWFTSLDWSDIIEDLKVDDALNAEVLVSSIFNDTYWVDDFRNWWDFSPEENDGMSDEDIRTQLREVIEVPLIEEFKANWNSLVNV